MKHQGKPPRRILHTSDLHIVSLDDSHCKSLETVVNLAFKSQAELLIIAGDFFDSNRIGDDVLDFVREQICRLIIPVVILPGNHDCLIPNSVYNRNNHWQECHNVHILRDGRGETLKLPALNISIWGRPIDTDLENVHPLEGMPQPEDNGSWNIAMAHGFFVQSIPRVPNSYTITEAEIQGTKWDYMALGHVPLFRLVCNDPIACYSGAPTADGTAALIDFDEEIGVRVNHVL